MVHYDSRMGKVQNHLRSVGTSSLQIPSLLNRYFMPRLYRALCPVEGVVCQQVCIALASPVECPDLPSDGPLFFLEEAFVLDQNLPSEQ